ARPSRSALTRPCSRPISAPGQGRETDMLTITGLFAGYGGGDVLRGVDLTVAEGSITCVVGPNGAGKSTLLKIVSGLLRPRLGSVNFRGTEIGGGSPPHKLPARDP